MNVKHQETLNLIREENQAAIKEITTNTGNQLQSFQTVITERCDQSDARTADLERKLNSLANQIASSTVSSSNTSLTVSNNSTQASTSSDMERIQHGGYHLRRNELDKGFCCFQMHPGQSGQCDATSCFRICIILISCHMITVPGAE